MGMDVGVDEAKQIVKFYDVEGDGEMRYQDLVKDVVEGVPHFMTHPNLTGRDTRRDERVELGSASTKEAPEAVKRIEAKIRDAAEVAATKSVTRIGGQDLFYGTCIRFDAGNIGSLSRADLDRALREIRCKLGEVETRHLVGWYDQGARDSVMYKNLVRSVWSVTRGGGTTARGGGTGEKKMNFKSDALTARANRAGVLAEKARIERKIKDIALKEKMLKTKLDTIRQSARR
jgi:hypothetical protein